MIGETSLENLYLQDRQGPERVVVLGEVLWDVFPHARRLGGAPLNFAVHATRLGHPVSLVSALGDDELGREAAHAIAALGLNTSLLQTAHGFPTGTACVELGPEGRTRFLIPRPAAYDGILTPPGLLELLARQQPGWLYFGTLLASRAEGRAVLDRMLDALPKASRFYDLNLRPGNDSPRLVLDLMERADVVKLNEEELHTVREFSGLPEPIEQFCREGSRRFGWRAVCVTLGERGCALLVDEEYAEAAGHPVDVADPVGAGDAFAAAFLHGLISKWPVETIASFANRVGALVASRHGAIPDWTFEEVVQP